MKAKIIITLSMSVCISMLAGNMTLTEDELPSQEQLAFQENLTTPDQNKEIVSPVPQEEPKVYEDMTQAQVIEQIDKSFTSTLTGRSTLFVNYALELGVDPFLASAIMLEETGCTWKCSKLVRECNNIGGQKGSPSCNGGSYKRYDTLDEGIIGFLTNLSNNYYKKGLTTPEMMNSKYAASPVWAEKVNRYINKIKTK